MPGDVEEASEAKEWEDNNGWLGSGAPWKAVKSALTSGLLRPLLLRPTRTGDASTSGVGPSEKKLRPTAYLDGLRGFAAFIVYWHHHELWARRREEAGFLEHGFGHGGQHYLASFPGIRTFFGGGHFAVSIFFVISGYVLSTKPMSLIHAGDQAKLADNLGSALFRRWLRLYIPLICVTFIYMTSWHLFPFWIDGAKKQSTYGKELWAWYAELKNFSFVFNGGGEPWFTYGFHLWSIPVEFRGSIVVYTILLALARCSRNARLWLETGLVFYFLYIADGWYCALFSAGVLLCDLDLLAAKDDLPAFFGRLRPHSKALFNTALAVSFYLGGVPSSSTDLKNLRDAGGWYYLSYLKPQAVFDYKWFYLFWAATLLVASIPRTPWLRRFFEARFCQYLGRLSFALYLVHGPVLWTLGDRMYALAGWENDARKEHIPGWLGKFPLPQIGPKGLEVAFLLPNLVLLPVTFYCAEVVTRMFDEPSVRFPQWFHKKTLGRPAGLPG
ncbi:acyltransferase family-domain-containing protein [Immersiella caudata]|uniref:Acyltransferase family-domain-containing protein n=1 Tax=Immersiella caudata TaxID=314043 RepID=A0AA39WVY4_9PEZI|nr:acyltransferase family-domain-containing protein [Immersiella caudata]